MCLPALRDADIFYNLSPDQLDRIAAICTEVSLSQGTVLFEENSPGDELYLISRGAVDILVDPAMLGLETDINPTTVATLRIGRRLLIRRDDLIRLCEEDYKLGYMIMRNIAADLAFKIRGTDLMVREQSLWRPQEFDGAV